MSLMPLVLCFSRDQRLLETRVAVLAKQYQVVPVSTLEEMRDLPNGTTFDLILLCHTLRKEDCEGAREIIRQRWPAATMLSMTKGDQSCSTQDGEMTVRGLDGPAVLLQKIYTLLHPIF